MHKAYDLGRAKARPFRFLPSAIANGLAVLLCIATLASFFGPWSWRLDLLTQFRPQLAVFGIFCITVALLSRAQAALAASLIATFVNAAPVTPYIFGQSGSIDAVGQTRVRVMAFNMQGRNTDQAALHKLIEHEDPDVVLLSEVPSNISLLLSGWEDRFPHRIAEEQGIPLGIFLLSRWKPARFSADRAAAQFRPVLTAELCQPDIGTHCFTFIGLHAAQPFAGELTRQTKQIEIATREVKAASPDPVVLVGDLNLTPWSRAFRSLLEDGELSDTAILRGLTATWSSRFPLLGLSIDHVLVNDRFKILNNRVGDDLGSDHFPVVADIAFNTHER